MTIVSSSDSNRSESLNNGSNPLKSNNLLDQIASRPDRNTHNGQAAQIKATSEAAQQKMMEAVYTMLESVGEDPEREV